MSLHNDIRAGLESRLAGTSGLPAARAWESTLFEPPPINTPYVRALYQPTSSRRTTMGNNPWFQHLGLFLVDVFFPHGAGPQAAEAMADAVRARFPVTRSVVWNGVQIGVRYSERSAGLPADGRFMVPVTVAWRVVSQQG